MDFGSRRGRVRGAGNGGQGTRCLGKSAGRGCRRETWRARKERKNYWSFVLCCRVGHEEATTTSHNNAVWTLASMVHCCFLNPVLPFRASICFKRWWESSSSAQEGKCATRRNKAERFMSLVPAEAVTRKDALTAVLRLFIHRSMASPTSLPLKPVSINDFIQLSMGAKPNDKIIPY